jgi:serine/threonine protein kinase
LRLDQRACMTAAAMSPTENSLSARHFASTPYHLQGQIGEGGMGSVYLVEHRETGAPCVLKVVHAHLVPDRQALDRFRLEAQSLGRLDHPHVVAVLGAGHLSDGRPYIALEYLRGSTLSERMQEGPLGEEEALEWARQYLSALQAAHAMGIVHRDFKPANIFLSHRADGSIVVKVLDFGLAKVLPDAPTAAPAPLFEPTTEGVAIGTPRYMSPEAASGKQVDERADVYAAALILYKMLAGRGPFDHHPQHAQQAAHVREEPAPPSAFAQVDARLDAIVLRALSKDPGARFRSAREFADALADFAAEPPPRRRSPRAAPPKKANQLTMGRLALLFILALVFSASVTAWVQSHASVDSPAGPSSEPK